jgi:hypothetical protein
VREEQRDAIRAVAPLVHKVHLEVAEAIYVDDGGELGQLVDLGLLGAPVEAIGPVLGEALDVAEGRAVVPIVGEVDLLGVGGAGELGLDGLDGLVRYGDLEGFDGSRHGGRSGMAKGRKQGQKLGTGDAKERRWFVVSRAYVKDVKRLREDKDG